MLDPNIPLTAKDYEHGTEVSYIIVDLSLIHISFYHTPEKLKGKSNYYLTDDDRLFWWDGTDEVVISEEMNIWLEELADRHRKLMELPDAGCGDIFDSSNFIESFIILLDVYKRQ